MIEPAMTRRVYRLLVFLPILVVLVGCQRQLIPTPNLYLDRELDPFADVPPPLRTNTADLLYTCTHISGGPSGIGSIWTWPIFTYTIAKGEDGTLTSLNVIPTPSRVQTS